MAKKLTKAQQHAWQRIIAVQQGDDELRLYKEGKDIVAGYGSRIASQTLSALEIAGLIKRVAPGSWRFRVTQPAPETISAAPAKWYAVSLPDTRPDSVSTDNPITPVSFDEVMARTTQPGSAVRDFGVGDRVRYTGDKPLSMDIKRRAEIETVGVIEAIDDTIPESICVRFPGQYEAITTGIMHPWSFSFWMPRDDLELWKPEGEADTLRKEHADLIIERDALLADRRRLVAALDVVRDLLKDEMGEWLPVSVEHLPDNLTVYRSAIDMINEVLDDDRPLLDTMLNGEEQ